MDIQTTITDDQAAALAQQHRVAKYADGNDLIAQVAADASLQAKKRGLIGSIAVESDCACIDAAIDAFNAQSSAPVKMPPSKQKGSVGVAAKA